MADTAPAPGPRCRPGGSPGGASVAADATEGPAQAGQGPRCTGGAGCSWPWPAAVVLALLVGAVAWYQSQMGGSGGATVVVTVTPGSSMGTITVDAGPEHVVDSSLAFRVYLTLHGTPAVQPGTYLLHHDESFADGPRHAGGGAQRLVGDGPARLHHQRGGDPGGQIAGHDPAHFLSLANSGTLRSPYEPAGSTNLDGLVGTGTYLVVPGESDETLLGAMIDRFNTAGGLGGAHQSGRRPRGDAVPGHHVASIVQKEGVYQKNLGKVARVIYNRLARGTPLQMDSTVLYSEHRDGGG